MPSSSVNRPSSSSFSAVESRLPSFGGATGWLNSPPLTPAGLRGNVVLVNFWTYTCGVERAVGPVLVVVRLVLAERVEKVGRRTRQQGAASALSAIQNARTPTKRTAVKYGNLNAWHRFQSTISHRPPAQNDLE